MDVCPSSDAVHPLDATAFQHTRESESSRVDTNHACRIVAVQVGSWRGVVRVVALFSRGGKLRREN